MPKIARLVPVTLVRNRLPIGMEQHLNYQERRPPAELAGLLRCVWHLSGPEAGPSGARIQPIVPDGCPEIVLNLADHFVRLDTKGTWARQPRFMLVGQLTGPALVGPSGVTQIVGLRFTPWGAARFFGVPASEFRDAFLPLDEVPPRRLEILVDRLVAKPHEDWADTVFEFLRGGGDQSSAGFGPSPRAVNAIFAADGRVTIRALARRLHVGERQLERIMRRDVGLPPMALVRIARVQGALRLILGGPERSLSEVAVAAGYYDQSHFVREFRRLVGCTPSQFRNGSYGLTQHFVSPAPRVAAAGTR